MPGTPTSFASSSTARPVGDGLGRPVGRRTLGPPAGSAAYSVVQVGGLGGVYYLDDVQFDPVG